MALKIGTGLNAPRIVGGRMTGYDVQAGYALMRAVARTGIGKRKAFRWQRCRTLIDTLREHREESKPLRFIPRFR